MKLFRINSLWTALRALLGWPLLGAGLYVIAAFIGSLIPLNKSWVGPVDGTTLYLHDNGIHTSIVIPCALGEGKNACLFPTIDVPDGSFPVRWQMIGWGDREFYLNTPTWSDLDLSTAAAAFVGSGRTLVHIDHLADLPSSGLKALKVDDKTLIEIMQSLYRSAAINDNASPKLTPMKGYGRRDVFYEGSKARVRNYSIFYTCNNWVSEILGQAGVKTGYWTPLPFGVMWWHA